jgi:hypothetical protein
MNQRVSENSRNFQKLCGLEMCLRPCVLITMLIGIWSASVSANLVKVIAFLLLYICECKIVVYGREDAVCNYQKWSLFHALLIIHKCFRSVCWHRRQTDSILNSVWSVCPHGGLGGDILTTGIPVYVLSTMGSRRMLPASIGCLLLHDIWFRLRFLSEIYFTLQANLYLCFFLCGHDDV